METLLILLTLWLISGHCLPDAIRVTGQLGSSLTFPCRYLKTYTNHTKSVCIFIDESCRTLVSLDPHSTEAREGRFLLAYNREERTQSVTINGLLENDRAVYQCRARTGMNQGYYEVTTIVLYVIGRAARSVDLRCPYDPELAFHSKHLYRGACSTNAAIQEKGILFQSNQSDSLVTRGRFSLYDNTTAHVLTMTIINLTAEDSGKYCCVLERHGLTAIQTQHLLFFDDNVTERMPSIGDPVHMPVAVPLITGAAVIGFMFLIIFIWKRTYKGSSSLPANSKCGDLSEERISHPDETSRVNSVYAVVTFPQETPLYSLAQLSRPDNHIYSCLELPQNTSSDLSQSAA